MSTSDRIAQQLFREYPQVVRRTISESLRVGDLVVDRGYKGLPRVPDDGIGRIQKMGNNVARVAWRDGTVEDVQLSAIAHVHEPYEPVLHDSAFDVPRFAEGTQVLLGNGDRGKVLEQIIGPTGFKTYRVQVTSSTQPMTVGRRVYATQHAMVKVGSVSPDVVVAFYKDTGVQPQAVVAAELAIDPDTQVVGLQKYSGLPTDHGMLFPYDPPRDVTFHMGSVRFPIDVIFVDGQGVVAAIEEQCEPGYDEYWRHRRIAGVLEVNGGWCQEHGIGLYDRVRLVDARTARATGPQVPENWSGQFPPNFGPLALRSSSREDIAPRALYSNRDFKVVVKWVQDVFMGRWLYNVVSGPNENIQGEPTGFNTIDQAAQHFVAQMQEMMPQGRPPSKGRQVRAQEHFTPDVNRADMTPRMPSGPPGAMGPAPTERFKGHDLPDTILENQPMDPGHWDQDIGYDQGSKGVNDMAGPGTRPGP